MESSLNPWGKHHLRAKRKNIHLSYSSSVPMIFMAINDEQTGIT
jgi:hypothetical protein